MHQPPNTMKVQRHMSLNKYLYSVYFRATQSANITLSRIFSHKLLPPSHATYRNQEPGMRSRDIFGRLRLRLRLQGSIPAPAPAPALSKTFRRLRLPAPAPVKIYRLRRLRLRLRLRCWSPLERAICFFFSSKMSNVKKRPLTDLTLSLNVSLNECLWNLSPRCHPTSLADIGEITESFGLRCLR